MDTVYGRKAGIVRRGVDSLVHGHGMREGGGRGSRADRNELLPRSVTVAMRHYWW